MPTPGPVWGIAPERPAGVPRRALLEGVLPRASWLPGYLRTARRLAADAQVISREWVTLDVTTFDDRVLELRQRLRRGPLESDLVSTMLAAAAAASERALGIRPYDTQLLAALLLLDGRLAEMATGEGKTIAAALAAAIQALAGSPVHLVTANDYLVQRDAAELGPYYAALGLQVRHIVAGMPSAARREAYAADVTYCTAKELAFDYLRDRLLLGSRHGEFRRRAESLLADRAPQERPVMRGLCAAIVDEADSILIDEATLPLVIAQTARNSERRAFLWQALTLARQLAPATDFHLPPGAPVAELTTAGEARLASEAAALGGPWQRRRLAHETVQIALFALHGMERDRDYLVRGQAVCPLDKVTGRAAEGRVWSRGLQSLLEMKENCPISAETETVARTSFPRFFRRYLQLSGMSGTLREAAGELRRLYGLQVVRVPLQNPLRRTEQGIRLFHDDDSRWETVITRVRELRDAGRPVLVGTDSISDTEALARHLAAAGIECAVLHARQDAEEAQVVGRAGEPGRVTVSTRMAGRGTDIRLAPGVAGLGGLHVINCQHNPIRRLDRQLAGRCARQGDPGSVELCIRCDLFRGPVVAWCASFVTGFARRTGRPALARIAAVLASALTHFSKRLDEAHEARRRRRMLAEEQRWESGISWSVDRD